MILHVDVVNKIATFQKRDGCIVCGNSDYKIKFSFDSEWDGYTEKTARFIHNGQFIDVDLTGDTCDVPILYDTTEVEVGVYAGDLKTTTSARIGCRRSILCETATPSEEDGRIHASEAKVAADRAEAAAKLAEEYAGKIIIEGGGISAEVERRLTDLEADVDELQKNGSISEEVEKQLTDLEAAIDAINATLNYEKIYFKSITMEPSTTEYGYGASVERIKLKWELSKTAKSITVNGKTLEDPTSTEYEAKGPFTTDQSWTVVATYKKDESATATKSIRFYYRVYWGIGTQASGFDANNFVTKDLQHNDKAYSRAKTFTVTPQTQYIYYAVPENLCEPDEDPTFIIDKGFAGGFQYVENNIDVAGIPYRVYRSDQQLVGSTRVEVS